MGLTVRTIVVPSRGHQDVDGVVTKDNVKR